MTVLHLRLLGGFDLRDEETPVTPPSQARLQSFLAYLALQRDQTLRRQQVAFLFWPDLNELHARANLRKMLYDLRRVIPHLERYLQLDDATLQWQPELRLHLDTAAFEQALARAYQTGAPQLQQAALQEAVTLYRGELLPGCYDEWVLPVRERLRQSYLATLEQLVKLLEVQRHYAQAVAYAQQLLQIDPLHETSYRGLMRLHALQGDRARALRVYHTCMTVLREELGVEPGPETQAVYQQLLHSTEASASTAIIALAGAIALVGRQEEWAILHQVWQQACAGHPNFLLIAGEPGIGKSRLAEEARQWLSRQGYATAATRAYAAEGRLAYAPITDWLREESLHAHLAKLDGVWLSEVARLLPEVLAARPEVPAPQPMSDSWQRQRFWEALARAMLLSGEPLLLVLDDLQWCERETLEWLHFLLRFEAHARLLVIGTVRPEEVDEQHPLTTLLLNLSGNDILTEIELGPLDNYETAALAAQMAKHELRSEAAQRLYKATEGNPLFVVEMVRAGFSGERAETGESERRSPRAQLLSLPPKVQAVIHARLAQLSPAARNLAELAATLGRAFSFEVLAKANDNDEETLVRGLDELWRRRLIREQGGSAYDFSHDRIRDGVYGDLSAARRRLLHRRVAQALESVYPTDLDSLSAQLAAHYEQAGLTEQAIAYYRRAASVAQHLYAYSETIGHLHKSLALMDTLLPSTDRNRERIDILLLLGDIYIITEGHPAPEVGETFNQAWLLCQEIENIEIEKPFLSMHSLRTYWAQRGRLQKAAEMTKEMLRLAEQMGDTLCLQDALRLSGADHFHQGKLTEARKYYERADAVYKLHQPPIYAFENEHDPEMLCLSRLTITLWMLGYPDQAQLCMDEARALAHMEARPFSSLNGLNFVFIFAHYQRNLAVAQAAVEAMSALLAKYPLPEYVIVESMLRGWLAAAQGDRETGIALLKQGLETLRQRGKSLFMPHTFSLLVEACAWAQQIEQGLAVVTETLALAEATGEHFWSAELYRLQGELLLAQGGDLEECEECFQQALALARRQEAKMLELRAACSLARLWQQQGRRAEAHTLLAEIYGWFGEGFDTPDLIDARALLAAR